MKNMRIILAAGIAFGVLGCSENPATTEGGDPGEVDSLVEEVWLDLNESTLAPLKDWAAQPANEVDFLSREEALSVAQKSLAEHRVELLAVTDSDLPDWTQFIVCDATRIEDREAFRKLLISATAAKKLEVEFGNKWAIFTEAENE